MVEPADPALKTALVHAFEEPPVPPFRRTKAVVVVHDGKVVAERYAPGIGVETPPGAMQLTRTPKRSSSRASTIVSDAMPAFAAA